MNGEAYELLALVMRYVFVVLGAVVLLRALRQMRKDARAHKKEMKLLPDAGLVGEVVDLDTGKSHPLPREGLMGSGGGCDIRLKRRGVKRRHALFEFVEGKGLRIKPHMGHKVAMEGVPLKAPAYALHGTHVTLGEAHIRIRLFAGLNVPNPATFAADLPPYDGEMMAEWMEQELPAPFEAVPKMPPVYGGAMAQNWQEQPFYAPQTEDETPVPEQMPWMQEQPAEDEYVPYQSPVERHRRSDRR